MIRTLLNLIWLVLGGFLFVLAYTLIGLVLCALVITAPFGIACLRIAHYALWPFGNTVVPRADAGVGSLLGNVLWVVLVGWWLAIGHAVHGIALCLTIIGIPLGLVNLKLVPISLLPLGVRIVPTT